MKHILKITALITVMVTVFAGSAFAAAIAANTTLTITIKGVPGTEQTRISGQYVVDSSGYVYLPLLKNGIRASGSSSSSLARRIEAAYRSAEIYQNPRITVISTKDVAYDQIDLKVVIVGGFVKRPGPVPFMRGMTLFQAISAAGGETAFGSIKRVALYRNGKKHVYDLRKQAHMQLRVYPGDSINVPQKTAWGN